MKNLELSKRTYLARVLVHNVGEKIRQEWTSDIKYARSGTNRYTSSIETALSGHIIDKIEEIFPEDNCLCDNVFKDKGSATTWYIHPIDGTKYYIREIPLFSTSIAILEQGIPVVGVVFNPVSHTMYWTNIALNGVYRNYTLIESINSVEIDSAVVALDVADFDKFDDKNNIIDIKYNLAKNVYRVRDFGSGVLSMSWLITKSIDAYIMIVPKRKHRPLPYAGISLLNSLGGAYLDDSKTFDDLNFFVAAKSKTLLESLLKVIRPQL